MFKILSVAETNYESDKIVLEHHDWKSDLRVEVLNKKKIIFSSGNNKIEVSNFARKELRSFINALQEAEVFLAEAELVDKLMGK